MRRIGLDCVRRKKWHEWQSTSPLPAALTWTVSSEASSSTGKRVGEGRYHVVGGDHAHWVDLYTASIPRCDCGDHIWRERICKHILAALLREGNDTVVRALGSLVERLKPAA